MDYLDARKGLSLQKLVWGAWTWVVLLFQHPARGAVVFAPVLGVLTLPAGSAGTVWLFAGSLYALIMIGRGRLAIAVPRTVLPACLVCLAYFGSTLVSPLFFPNPWGGWMDVGTSLQFLAFVVLVMAMAQTHEVDTLDLYLWGLRISAILACIVAAIQVLVLHQVRAKGGMANPIPFSNVALLAGALSLIGLERLRPWQRLVALVAALCGLAATLLSQTRGALIAVPLAVLVLLILNRRLIIARWKESAVFAGVAIVAFAALFVVAKLPERFEILSQGFESQTALMRGDPSTSHRAILWSYGAKSFAERPLGYGSQNAVSEVRRVAARDGYEVPPYNHLHNEFITAGVGRGVIGVLALIAVLLAPVLIAWRSVRDDRYEERLAFATILSGSYFVFGLTNVLFGQDQLNSFYVGSFIILTVAIHQAAIGATFVSSWALLFSLKAPSKAS